MRGKCNGGWLLNYGNPYRTYEQALNRLRRIRRDEPTTRDDNTRVADNGVKWYYDVLPYGNGYGVLSSYDPSPLMMTF